MALFDDRTTKRAKKEHRADTDFSQARQKAFWDEIKGFLLRKSTRLLPFDEVKNKLEVCFIKDLGIQTIPTICGTVGKRWTKPIMPNKVFPQWHYTRYVMPISSRMVTTESQWLGPKE
jgi:hypothetical protein